MLRQTIKNHIKLLFNWAGPDALDEIIRFCLQLQGGGR
jgi:hypothetical protein